jgi:hypothetical protein
MKKEKHNRYVQVDANNSLNTFGITSQFSNIPAHSNRQYIDRALLIPYKLDSKRLLFSANDIIGLSAYMF